MVDMQARCMSSAVSCWCLLGQVAGAALCTLAPAVRIARMPIVCSFADARVWCLLPQYVSKLVIVPGIVTASSRPKHKATYFTIQCKTCK